MDVLIGWNDILVRIALTLLASAILGINREEHGRSAGLRTTMLVSLAAALSMIQVNLLLDMNGKTPSSFAVMDLMRLPLGILSGMGFIGAGAIMRKDSLVTGVTTAATLWFATMMGLCFGGGQLALGLIALLSAVIILWGLKAVEKRWHRAQEGVLSLTFETATFQPEETARRITQAGGKVAGWTELVAGENGKWTHQSCRVTWNAEHDAPPPFVQALSTTPGVTRLELKITSHGN